MFDESFLVGVQYVVVPKGSCLDNVPVLLQNKLKAKQCVVQITDQDALCMARALFIGKASADEDAEIYESLYKRKTAQTKAVTDLINAAGFSS